jgi:peroxiredoxin
MIILVFAAVVVLAAPVTHGQSSAALALKQINSELAAKSKTMSPYDYVEYLEKSMNDFLKKYPTSPEAAQAHFSLARVYASVGEYQKAVDHFSAYLAMPGERGGADVIAQAKYVMGTCYVGLERYDDAERSFRDVVGSSKKIDTRISDAAKTELARIGTLRKLKIGAPAIDIAGTSFQGKKIRLLKDYRGKVVLLDFWAAWCNPCRMEMPNVIGIYNDLHKQGFEIIGISLDNEKEKFQNFIQDNKMEWPQLYDGKYWMSDYAKLYAVSSIPATFVIDKKGNIRFKNVRGEQLREAVQQLLDEK